MNWESSVKTIKEYLTPLVGSYFIQNQAIPAIAIISGEQEYPPPGTKIEGTEAVVFLPTISPSINLDGSMSKRRWEILIKFWDDQTTPEILGKIDEIVQEFPWELDSMLHLPPVQSRMQPEIIRIIWIEYV